VSIVSVNSRLNYGMIPYGTEEQIEQCRWILERYIT